MHREVQVKDLHASFSAIWTTIEHRDGAVSARIAGLPPDRNGLRERHGRDMLHDLAVAIPDPDLARKPPVGRDARIRAMDRLDEQMAVGRWADAEMQAGLADRRYP